MFAKKFTVLMIVLCITFAALALSPFTADAATTIEEDREQLEQYKEEYENAKEQRQQIQEWINELENEKTSILDEKNYLEYEIGYLISEIDALETLIDSYDKEIANLEIEIDTRNSEINTYIQLIRDIIKYTYVEGDPSIIEILLSSDSLNSFLSKVDFASYMIDYNDKLLKELEDAVASLEKSKEEHETATAKLLSLKEENIALKEEYEQKKAELELKVQEFENNIYQYELLYQKQKQAEEEISRSIAELQEQIKEKEIYSGGWARPLPYSCKRISSDWGYRIYNGKQEFHNGVDMPAPTGTPIYAVQTGTVIAASFSPYAYGYYVVIDHGGNVSTIYGHCSQLLVEVGEKVNKGETIALVGSTGKSSGPHLHLGLMINGSWVNPETPGYFDAEAFGFVRDADA